MVGAEAVFWEMVVIRHLFWVFLGVCFSCGDWGLILILTLILVTDIGN